MTDQELRELVRESIAKQLAWRDPSGLAEHAQPSSGLAERRPLTLHASHGVYTIAREDPDGPCIIEPSVPCTHCDYCKSHGH